MDQEQAAEELKAIHMVMAQARQVIQLRGGGWVFFLWGCIWLIGFIVSQFTSPEVAGWLWAGIDTGGVIGTILIASRGRQRVEHRLERRLLLFWLLMAGYVALLWILLRLDYRQGSLVLLLTFALAYVLFGLFTSGVIALAGLAIAVFAVVAHLLVPEFFYLVVGLLNGGTLILLGLWMVRRWGG